MQLRQTESTEYCTNILYQAAAVHPRPFQSVLNAAARLVVEAEMRQHYSNSPR